MRRILIIDDGGIPRFEYSVDNHQLQNVLANPVSSVLFAAMIKSILAISEELGGLMQIIVIGTEKLSFRYLNMENDNLLLIVTDSYNRRDDLLYLKTEIISREISPFFEAEGYMSDNLINPFTMTLAFLETDEQKQMFHKILSENSVKPLMKILNKNKTEFYQFETVLNKIVGELPSPEIILDPSLIIVNNSSIVIPHNITEYHIQRLKMHILTEISPLIGQRFITKLFDKHGIIVPVEF